MVACARWSDRAWTGDAAARVAMTAAAVKMILAKDMFLFWGLLFGFVEDEKSYRSFWAVWKDAWCDGGLVNGNGDERAPGMSLVRLPRRLFI